MTGVLGHIDFYKMKDPVLLICMLSWLRVDKLINTLESLIDVLMMPVAINLRVQGCERLSHLERGKIENLISKFSRSKLTFTEGNDGTAGPRKIQLEEANSLFGDLKYICFGDDDISFSRGSLELLVEYLDKSLANEDFDFIMCDAFFAYIDEDWDLFKCPKAILIEDIHMDVPKWQIKKAKEVGIDIIFHRYYDSFHKYHKEAKNDYKCIWLPHSVDTDIFFDYGEQKDSVIHVGIINEYYPFRTKVVKALSGWGDFKIIPRPEESLDNKYKWPVKGKYAELVSSAKICVTGGSRYDISVLKYFEIPACNTVLASNWFGDLGYLGFYPNENMIVYEENILEQMKELYEDEDRLSKIAKEGMSMILSKHTVEKRAVDFINDIKAIV